MNRKTILMAFALCSILLLSSCDGNNTSVEEKETTTTTNLITTTTTTTTEESHYASDSTLASLAESYVKDKYSDYSPVVIGDVTVYDNDSRYSIARVRVKGHYWVSDSYGNNSKKRSFNVSVTIDKDSMRCSGG